LRTAEPWILGAPVAAPVADLCWPPSRLGEALDELARRAGLGMQTHDIPLPPEDAVRGGTQELGRWIEWAACRIGIEAEAVETAVPEVTRMLLGAGPALLCIDTGHGIGFVPVLRARFGLLHVIGPDLAIHRCPVELLRAAICARHEAPLTSEIDRLLAEAGVPVARRGRVRAAMLAQRLASEQAGRCWLLRLAPASGMRRQLARAGLFRRIGLMLGLAAGLYGLEILAWALVGRVALNGHADPGWLWAWMILILSMVPLRLLARRFEAGFAIDTGQLLKRRLLAGALNSDVEAVKRQGVGQLLSRVMESQALESLALNGGLSVLVAVIELGFSAWVLASGAGGWFHVLLLAAWLALAVALGWRSVLRLRAWTAARLSMTHELVEQMVGHRTRLAQEWPARRDALEDRAMRDYAQQSRQMDRAAIPVVALVPAGWLLLGLIGLAPAFVQGTGSAAGLAIGFGGVLLAARALSGMSSGLAGLARAGIAWGQVRDLFNAPAPVPSAAFVARDAACEAGSGGARTRLVDASKLVFRHDAHADPVLRDVSLSVFHGERILLQGCSGGGKSTLASLLVGLRQPGSGLLLLNGLDRHTLGDDWRRIATEAPQFHENHILSGTLGFNLLMGRSWPATDDELQEARELCVELGLGELLERMPSGMLQMVGETGWQLSHGERSRIFLARAILQDAQLTILDESFAALDPETLIRCLDCAFRRTQTLVVIAHP
jgi:ATP-binding cassette subfamily B protein